jgi:sporulation protein YlmC with PRC-barrel domain
MQDLRGDSIVARDGVVGSLKDVYFDDQRWGVRYLVVDTGRWLPGRKVLVSPAFIDTGPEAGGSAPLGTLRLRLSREEIEHSPPLDSALPVSRQFQEAHARYYRYNWYWTEPNLWGAYPGSAAERTDEEAFRQMKAAESKAERSHLRSTRAVAGYHIEAADGSLGHVEDFALDDEHWTIAGVLVGTRKWLPGRPVLVAPAAVRAIDWRGRKMVLRMSCDDLRRARDAL